MIFCLDHEASMPSTGDIEPTRCFVASLSLATKDHDVYETDGGTIWFPATLEADEGARTLDLLHGNASKPAQAAPEALFQAK
jgi:hypothetical protein